MDSNEKLIKIIKKHRDAFQKKIEERKLEDVKRF